MLPLCTVVWRAIITCAGSIQGVYRSLLVYFHPLTDDLVFSTNMSSYRSTIGIGELSQKSSTFAISHSESRPAEVEEVSQC